MVAKHGLRQTHANEVVDGSVRRLEQMCVDIAVVAEYLRQLRRIRPLNTRVQPRPPHKTNPAISGQAHSG
jgi:hypothetical protein